MNFTRLCFAFVALCTAAGAFAADPKLAIVYGAGGKFDKSYNQQAAAGAERFKKETSIPFLEVSVASDTQTEQVLRTLARKNVDLIAAIGFAQAQAVQTVAKEFPKVKFVLIDGVAQGDNVMSVLFKEQEGAYIVGVAAALSSKTRKVGFIGGMDIPLIRSFSCGYAQGAKSVDAKVDVTQNMVGSTPSAWQDPAKGAELARAQIEKGVDVVFAAAGGSGMGALKAASEKGKLAIGCDSNQNYLYPGTMLTSMLKRGDNAIYDSFMAVKNGSFKGGIVNKGVKDGGIDWALDADNRKLISPELEKKLNAVRADIISGKIKVVDYRENNSCPL
jgi:basic membrane protein A